MYLESREEVMSVAKSIADNVLEFGTAGDEYAQCERYIDMNFILTEGCRLQMLSMVKDHINRRRYK